MDVSRPRQFVQRCAPCPDIAATPEGKVQHSCVSLPVLHPERLKTAKAFVEKAVKMHKVFSVQGPYPVIREALRARGWVEQRMPCPNKRAPQLHSNDNRASSTDADDSDNDGDDDDDDNNSEVKKEMDGLHGLMSRLVRNEMVYFYWTNRRDAINRLQKEQIINHFSKAGTLTTKVGLCVNLRNLHWFDSADPDTFFPRCYRLGAQDEKQAFIEDYRRTACTSFLKYIIEREHGVCRDAMSPHVRSIRNHRKRSKSRPVVVSQMIDSALRVCQEFLESLEHKDIDISLKTQQTLTKEEWAEFINNYYLVVHDGAEIEDSDRFVCCKAMLQRLAQVSPQLDIEGIYNIWIIKPGAKSRGRGIKCVKYLDQILRLVDGDPALIKESKWVVQKYMECPFLVHGTKFDMRQWFLVTDWNPLTVWFYKKCYLRFSTQPYSLDTLDSSVHLCNNSIQKHLRPSQQRHRGIPPDNMWSDDQFRVFLSSQGQEAQWETVVVPGMKKAIIHALQTTQDRMESRKNTFELYGADFMLGRDLRPWLIEINASPTMAPSTPLTARLCTAVQEDTLRVVLDRRVERNANTGDFELIYRQTAVDVPQYVGVNLLIEGLKIKQPSNRLLPKHQGPVKKKDPAAVKAKPKVLLTTAETQLTNNSSRLLPPPPLSHLAAPPVDDPVEIFPLHIPVSIKTIHLPTGATSHSVSSWKKNNVPKVCSDKIQSRPIENHEDHSLELIISKQAR